MDREPIRCPLKEYHPGRKDEGCVNCIHYQYCIWFRIYEKLDYIESGVTKVNVRKE
jgi:hypothetical protein